MSKIEIKSAEEIQRMSKAGELLARVIEKVKLRIKAGITTEDLDKIADDLIRQNGAYPVFVGYRGYKHASCISINEEIVHGIPGKRVIKDGDIVSFDVGLKLDGFCADRAVSVGVGAISKKAEKLIRTCKAALKAGIKQARGGNHLGDISAAIQRVAEKNNYSVVRDLFGHGIGRELHEEPLIPNFGEAGKGPELKAGMVLAIEPMLNMGGWRIKTLADGWTVITADRQLSCHFEHTVLITEAEPKILTALGK